MIDIELERKLEHFKNLAIKRGSTLTTLEDMLINYICKEENPIYKTIFDVLLRVARGEIDEHVNILKIEERESDE